MSRNTFSRNAMHMLEECFDDDKEVVSSSLHIRTVDLFETLVDLMACWGYLMLGSWMP